MEVFIICLILALASIAALFVSRLVYNRLEHIGNRYARLYRVITFIFSFAVILAGIITLALFNLRLER